jgi:hypothetical protein
MPPRQGWGPKVTPPGNDSFAVVIEAAKPKSAVLYRAFHDRQPTP